MIRLADKSTAIAVALCAAVGIVLGACSQPPVPQDQFYRLTPRGPNIVFDTPPISGTVAIDALRADGLVSQRPVLYSERGKDFVLNQYHYHYWVESPPNMVQTGLSDYLAAARAATAVASAEGRQSAGCRVGGAVRRFERITGGGPSVVVVEIGLRINRTGDYAELWNRIYKVELQAGDERVESVVLAFNHAVSELFDQFAADLARQPISCPSAQRRG